MKKLFVILLVALSLMPINVTASEGLGIAVSFDASSQTDAEIAGSIWIGVEPGEVATRTIVIKSLSDNTPQQLSFQIFDQIRVDGQSEIDFSRDSAISRWVIFEPAFPILAPNEAVSVTMTLAVPEGAPNRAYEANLRVLSGAVDSVDAPDSDAGTRAIVGTKIAVDSGMWLGIGDALELAPDFEISGIDGVLIDGANFVRVFFENTGIMPIRPSGTFQLSDPSFENRFFEPIDFRGPDIRSGETGFVDVRMADDVLDGYYRAFVTVQADSVRKTKLFEGEIIFDDPNQLTLTDALVRAVMFIVASVGLVFGVRMLRKPKAAVETFSNGSKRRFQLFRRSRDKELKGQERVAELEETIKRMERRLETIIGETPTEEEKPARKRSPASGASKQRQSPAQKTSQDKARGASDEMGENEPAGTEASKVRAKSTTPRTARTRTAPKKSETPPPTAPKTE